MISTLDFMSVKEKKNKIPTRIKFSGFFSVMDNILKEVADSKIVIETIHHLGWTVLLFGMYLSM